jgi:molybdopterin/thiamine biosynthesis adenylyltransferase/rhodanese-related sulfurtransferase
MSEVFEISSEQAANRRAEGAVWIDVREPDEWEAAHIAATEHIPMADSIAEIERRWPDRDAPLLISCAVGSRSRVVGQHLVARGYTDVSNVSGGIRAWIEEGRDVVRPSDLSAEQGDRYSRHIAIPEVGIEGQRQLLKSRVLLLGAGGLGSPAAMYLAAAGVGTLGVVDDDVVERSNLQRQLLHGESNLGEYKAASAERTIAELNPDVTVRQFRTRMTSDNVMDIIGEGWDVIVDGTDNLPTRYLINDASVMHRIPVVHGSIYRFEGQTTVFHPFEGPCYRCLYPQPPPPELAPSCAEGGVLGVLPGIIGSLQAVETIKLLLGIGEPLVGRLLMYDALTTRFDTVRLRRDPACPACGDGERITELIDYEEFCAVRA